MLFHRAFTDKFNIGWASEETPLHLAVRNGHIKAVEALLRLSSYLHNKDEYIRWTAVFLHAPGLHGETPLISAVKLGRAPIVAVLLRHPDCGVNATDKLHMTALHWAAAYGTVSVVEDLLQVAAIDVNISGPQGKMPLMFAAKSNHFSAATALLKHARCDVNAKDDTRMCALHYAVVHGSVAITEALLQVGSVDVNASGPNGATPLILAAKEGNLSAAIALLDMLAVRFTQEIYLATMRSTVRQSTAMLLLLKHFSGREGLILMFPSLGRRRLFTLLFRDTRSRVLEFCLVFPTAMSMQRMQTAKLRFITRSCSDMLISSRLCFKQWISISMPGWRVEKRLFIWLSRAVKF